MSQEHPLLDIIAWGLEFKHDIPGRVGSQVGCSRCLSCLGYQRKGEWAVRTYMVELLYKRKIGCGPA